MSQNKSDEYPKHENLSKQFTSVADVVRLLLLDGCDVFGDNLWPAPSCESDKHDNLILIRVMRQVLGRFLHEFTTYLIGMCFAR